MSQLCTILKCERISRGLCDCCKQNLCLQHLNEHNALLISQLNPLTDEINALGDRFKSFNIHEAVSTGRQKLEECRKDYHEKIDRFFEEKYQELDGLIAEKLDRQRKEIFHIQSKMAKLIREQEATRQDIDLMTLTIRQLENEMKKIEETNFQINTHSLVINDSLVQIRETNEHEVDLSTLSSIYRALDSPIGSSAAIASNDRLLLIHQKPNLCLIDKDINIMKQVLWEHKEIRDMCWSSTLDRFIVIAMEENNIFLVDERTMSIENRETVEKQSWLSCACSDASLLLSTNVWGSSIIELRLSPSVAMIKEWKSPITCTKHECIDGMAYRNKACAIVIRNNIQKSVRMELRSCETLDRIWSLPLNIIVNQNVMFYSSSLNCNEWLVTDYETKHLLHITEDGKLKRTIPYSDIPYCATMFTSEMLAISTHRGTNLHKI
jgi:hypothetical protein